jgi:hypothetical protein
MDVEDEDNLEEDMSAPSFQDVLQEYTSRFTEDMWNAFIYPLLMAEQDRGGLSAEQNLVNVCRYAEGCYHEDEHNRDFQTFVKDVIVHAHKKAEELILEQGMKKEGGRVADATLLTPEEMEKQRRALFKPLLQKKKKPAHNRKNKAREKTQNKARGRDNKPQPEQPSSGGFL